VKNLPIGGFFHYIHFMTEEEYYQGRYEYWYKQYSRPGVRLVNMSIPEASEKTAKSELESWKLIQAGPQLIYCCDTFESEIQDGNMLWVDLPSTVHMISDGGHGGQIQINYCPFCGTKITPKQ
jgi:hypothetical protein